MLPSQRARVGIGPALESSHLDTAAARRCGAAPSRPKWQSRRRGTQTPVHRYAWRDGLTPDVPSHLYAEPFLGKIEELAVYIVAAVLHDAASAHRQPRRIPRP
jgi:hypothetical protein